MADSDAVTKTSFYGKKTKKSLSWKARLARKEREFKRCPTPSPYRPRLGGPSSIWKIFKTQQEAFSFARTNPQDLSVFSCESESFFSHHGQRLFLVTSYDQFWHYYRQLGTAQRHHYEVIPEGAVCRLYFDLEFSKELNPSKDGYLMTSIFIKYVNAHIEDIFDIRCEESHVLQLDASTDKKFSQHLIYHIPGAAFKDNIHAGYFVNLICNQLYVISKENPDEGPSNKRSKPDTADCIKGEQKASDDESSQDKSQMAFERVLSKAGLHLNELKQLFVEEKDGRNSHFCDTGVYTKNRNFRLFLSAKLHKNNPLVISKQNSYQPAPCGGVDQTPEERVFLESLVTNIQYVDNLRVLSMSENLRVKTCRPVESSQDQSSEQSLTGWQQSPYPEVDEYITSQLSRGGTQGKIRRWVYFSAGEVLVYDITNNRYCENIDRQHKSNNVIYVADLKKEVYYQKCHDPQCKADNFRSKEYPLPKDVLPSAYFSDILQDNQDLDLDTVSDADMLLAANQVERALACLDPNIPGARIVSVNSTMAATPTASPNNPNIKASCEFDDIPDDELVKFVDESQNIDDFTDEDDDEFMQAVELTESRS